MYRIVGGDNGIASFRFRLKRRWKLGDHFSFQANSKVSNFGACRHRSSCAGPYCDLLCQTMAYSAHYTLLLTLLCARIIDQDTIHVADRSIAAIVPNPIGAHAGHNEEARSCRGSPAAASSLLETRCGRIIARICNRLYRQINSPILRIKATSDSAIWQVASLVQANASEFPPEMQLIRLRFVPERPVYASVEQRDMAQTLAARCMEFGREEPATLTRVRRGFRLASGP